MKEHDINSIADEFKKYIESKGLSEAGIYEIEQGMLWFWFFLGDKGYGIFERDKESFSVRRENLK